jgi:hypothetical protein
LNYAEGGHFSGIRDLELGVSEYFHLFGRATWKLK